MIGQSYLKDRGRDIVAKIDTIFSGTYFLVRDINGYKLVPSIFVNEGSYITNGGNLKITFNQRILTTNEEQNVNDETHFYINNQQTDLNGLLKVLQEQNIKPRLDYEEYNRKKIYDGLCNEMTDTMRAFAALLDDNYIAHYTQIYKDCREKYDELHEKLKCFAGAIKNIYYNGEEELYQSYKSLERRQSYDAIEAFKYGICDYFDQEILGKQEKKTVDELQKKFEQLIAYAQVLKKIKNEIGGCHSMDGELFFKKVAAVMLKNKDILKKMPEDLSLNLGVGEWFVDYDVETGNVTIWCKETDRRVKIEQTFNINSPLLNKKYITYKFTNRDKMTKNISLPNNILPRHMNNAFILYDMDTKEQIVCKFGEENEYKNIVKVEDMDGEAVKSENFKSKFLKNISMNITKYDNFLDCLERIQEYKTLWLFDKNEKRCTDENGNEICVCGDKDENRGVFIDKGKFYEGKGFRIINGKRNKNARHSITKMSKGGKNYTFICK